MSSCTKADIGYMRRACLLCDNSKCGYKTGCVVVKEGKVVAESWNETLPGEVYCQNGECVREKEGLRGGKDIHKVCSIHAEASCIAQCAKAGLSVQDAAVYVSTFPCIICARLLAKSGIAKLFFMAEYPGGREAQSLLVNNDVKVIHITKELVWGKQS
ncbi:TPA: hypothetical protein DCY43_01310 [candidate division WWE3 bacterium]|uniref:dCMP deaminase n=4 Tax=Katanobacteria TaxID=422282 RepID=A0A0G1KMV0_UNCKA|nr:MAG: dCMP deaminase [candidate division WWE3 bacterium GW2011_GWA2_44_16]KKT84820.1 MAG: dCMP deaminase [candidate division WWE3 bacterium GW2011_GWC2_44_9]OGC52821.1 MAG: hypothetical protein A2709_00980 [candidate division WWE3 bacterium RIFCSPHIGHO2_01_FULL_43_9]HAZ29377.1 hypothetical protein [candidate division WWE3 bacterium]